MNGFNGLEKITDTIGHNIDLTIKELDYIYLIHYVYFDSLQTPELGS